MNEKAEDYFIEIIYIWEIPDFQNSWLFNAHVTENTLNLRGEWQVLYFHTKVNEIKFGHWNLPFSVMKIALLL